MRSPGDAVPLRNLSTASNSTRRDAQTTNDSEGEEHQNNAANTMPSAAVSQSSSPNRNVEARILRKLDTYLLPFLALLFTINSLDRSNIGNAETAHFTSDLGLQPSDLNTAVAIFFAFFVALQPIGAAAGRYFGMTRYVPVTMGCWGLCTMLHVFVKTKGQLIGLRVLIACLEAGFYPTTVAYLSSFYTRFEFGRRVGLFYGQYAVAGALGGLLSYLVFSGFSGDDFIPEQALALRDAESASESATGWRAWQVLFLLEGGLTMVIALIGFFWLPRSANTAWFLSQEEQRLAGDRITRDRQASRTTKSKDLGEGSDSMMTAESSRDHRLSREEDDQEAYGLLSDEAKANDPETLSARHIQPSTLDAGLSRLDVIAAVIDWKVWYLLVCNVLSAIPATAFSIFLPLVLQSLVSSPAYTNLLTVPPFLVGAVVLYAFAAWSDKVRERLKPILWSLGLLVVGLVAVVVTPSSWTWVRYAALCVLLSGTFVASPLTIAWLTNNIPEPGKRSVVLGINGWGNAAGILSSVLFAPQFAPTYELPFFVTLLCIALAFVGFASFHRLIQKENRRRAALLNSWSDEQIEVERTTGRAYGEPRSYGTAFSSVLKFFIPPAGRYLESGLDEWLEKGRTGDERMTFVFSL